MAHVCPWWGGYFIDNPLRRLFHNPQTLLAPYLRPGMTAMDFGCGMGLFALAMAELVGDDGRVIAADLQPQMLRTVKRRADRMGLSERVQLHECERSSLAFKGSFAFVLAFWSAHEVPDQQLLLQEFFDGLEEDGKLIVVEPVGHVSGRAFQQMTITAEDVGFQLVDHPKIRLSRAAEFVKKEVFDGE
jgi:ubiquinone/menaquinone biosynthesis C-methylase UbiE